MCAILRISLLSNGHVKRILCIIHFVWFLATFPFSVSGFVCLCVFFAASSVINK